MSARPWIVAACALAAAPAEAQVVAGRVVLKGDAPALAPIKITRDEKVCGAEVPDESLIVGADRAIANAVVVVVADPPAPAPAPSALAIDQKDCRFAPHVAAVTLGSSIDVGNSDPVLHNARAMHGDKQLFNVALPLRNVKRRVSAAKPGVLDLRCDAGHTWMHALIHVVPHPWFAVTDAAGRFRIEGVPAGAKALEIRHERLRAPLVIPLDAARQADLHIELSLPGG